MQQRLPQELRLAGIGTDLAATNRFITETFLPAFNRRLMVEAEETRSAFVPLLGFDLNEAFCLKTERQVQRDNTVRYKGLSPQIPTPSATAITSSR